jgi:hypothetical protein
VDKFESNQASKMYEDLEEYAAARTEDISSMMDPYIQITDRYGQLISRIVLMVGNTKPTNVQDIVVRDLIADVFDCLYETRSLILAGKLNVAFPIARRAYESLSLLHLCAVNESWAKRWQNGKKIRNAEIRRELNAHPMGESEEKMKELYNFFCSATHPNRELIPRRFLGDGNEYVLGAIGAVNLVMVIDYCMKILDMWFWLTAIVSFFYCEIIAKINEGYPEAYHQVAEEAKKTKRWLIENFNRLLKEEQEYWERNPTDE